MFERKFVLHLASAVSLITIASTAAAADCSVSLNSTQSFGHCKDSSNYTMATLYKEPIPLSGGTYYLGLAINAGGGHNMGVTAFGFKFNGEEMQEMCGIYPARHFTTNTSTASNTCSEYPATATMYGNYD